jgi:hypothetical protein
MIDKFIIYQYLSSKYNKNNKNKNKKQINYNSSMIKIADRII